jgi:hypothetical protein
VCEKNLDNEKEQKVVSMQLPYAFINFENLKFKSGHNKFRLLVF